MSAASDSEDRELSYAAISYTWDTDDRIWYEQYTVEPKAICVDDEIVAVSDKVANILSLMCQVSNT